MKAFWDAFEKSAANESEHKYPSSLTGLAGGAAAGHALGKRLRTGEFGLPGLLAHGALMYAGARHGSRALGSLKYHNSKDRAAWDKDWYGKHPTKGK